MWQPCSPLMERLLFVLCANAYCMSVFCMLAFWMRGVCQCRHVGTCRAKTVSGCLSAPGCDNDWVERLQTCSFQADVSAGWEDPFHTWPAEVPIVLWQRCEAVGGCRVPGCHSMCLTSSFSGWRTWCASGLCVNGCPIMRQFVDTGWLLKTLDFIQLQHFQTFDALLFFEIYSYKQQLKMTLESLLWLTKTTLSSEQQRGWVLRLWLHHSDMEAP